MKTQTTHGIELNKTTLTRWIGEHPTLLAIVIALLRPF
jgi:hypothetical protein